MAHQQKGNNFRRTQVHSAKLDQNGRERPHFSARRRRTTEKSLLPGQLEPKQLFKQYARSVSRRCRIVRRCELHIRLFALRTVSQQKTKKRQAFSNATLKTQSRVRCTGIYNFCKQKDESAVQVRRSHERNTAMSCRCRWCTTPVITREKKFSCLEYSRAFKRATSRSLQTHFQR